MSKEKVYGIWNAVDKRFVFGIKESSKMKANKTFSQTCGKLAYLWRYSAKEIPVEFENPKNPTQY